MISAIWTECPVSPEHEHRQKPRGLRTCPRFSQELATKLCGGVFRLGSLSWFRGLWQTHTTGVPEDCQGNAVKTDSLSPGGSWRLPPDEWQEEEFLPWHLICTWEINCSCHWCLPWPCRALFPAEPALHPVPPPPAWWRNLRMRREGWGGAEDQGVCLLQVGPLLPLALLCEQRAGSAGALRQVWDPHFLICKMRFGKWSATPWEDYSSSFQSWEWRQKGERLLRPTSHLMLLWPTWVPVLELDQQSRPCCRHRMLILWPLTSTSYLLLTPTSYLWSSQRYFH